MKSFDAWKFKISAGKVGESSEHRNGRVGVGAEKIKSRSNWGPKTKRIKLTASDASTPSPTPTAYQGPPFPGNEAPSELNPVRPKLTLSLPGVAARRKSVTERRSSKDVAEATAADLKKISEDEARKKKYQPQVVVEKMDPSCVRRPLTDQFE